MRFVRRELFVEPAELQVSVIVERSALDTSLRKFDVLQQGQCFILWQEVEILLCEAC